MKLFDGAATVVGAQNAEPAIGHPLQDGRFALALELVGRVTQKGEMVIGQPFDEGLDLVQLIGGHVPRAGRQFVDHGSDRGAHGGPILHRLAHVLEDAAEILLEALEQRRIALPIDLDMHEAFGLGVRCRLAAHGDAAEPARGVALHGEDRMDREVDREAVPIELHGHAVDQKRHVVGDDLDDGMRRLPAMLLRWGL